ncbi:MAG: hypothetical protein ACW9W3_01790 [Candidatus Nitrosopumilus sp. bin_68KS]
MPKSFLFFLFLIPFLIIQVSIAYGDTVATAYLLPEGETAIANDEVVLNDNSNLNLSENVIVVDQTTKSIGGIDVNLTQKVKFIATKGTGIKITNTQLSSITVSIPDKTTMSAPSSWNGKITPPKQITTSGTIPSGFQTPTTSIQVGSPDVILIFDKSVTIILEGTTGQTAYKLPGQTSWILISTCLGTYDNPTDPPVDGECSISNGVDTKIVTFHFTEFTGLSTTSTTTTTTTPTISSGTSNSGGGGGSRSSSSSSGSSSTGYAGKLLPEGAVSESSVFPKWFQTSLVTYWIDGLITDYEFKNAMNYMLNKNIIKIDIIKEKDVPLLDLAPSIKQLFKLWSLDKLSDSAIINIVKHYRTVGVW